MRTFPLSSLAALAAVVAAPAHAAKLTLGSDLSAPATVVEAHGADTAFWLDSLNGAAVDVPEDGQVVSIKVRGTAVREKGAGDPADIVHFQTLDPAGPRGERKIHLTSSMFHMPIDQPDAITTFEPENLCVRKGGAVAFNTIGGFKWGGSLDAPLDEDHYWNGTPWQIFAQSGGASTAWYSKDNGTKNGMTMTPSGGTDAGSGHGAVMQGKELLMQVVVATGDDRSQACGGPRRHADGSLVDTGPDPMYMKVVTSGGKPQRPYVSKDRKFQTGVYCGGEAEAACTGTATMLFGKKNKLIASAGFSIPKMSTGRIAMRLNKKMFRKLDKSKKRTLKVTYVLTTPFGTYTSKLTLKR